MLAFLKSCHSFMWNNFFKHIDIRPENTHILDGNAADLQAECDAFEEKIQAAGGVELFVGGEPGTLRPGSGQTRGCHWEGGLGPGLSPATFLSLRQCPWGSSIRPSGSPGSALPCVILGVSSLWASVPYL